MAATGEATETKELGSGAAAQAYDAIASLYDDFTFDHEYEGWTANLLAALGRHGLSGDRLLDIGCGTGKSFLPMLGRGWRVTACDISAAMIARARAKTEAETELHVADMRKLPRFGEFDLVWTLGDAINYLLDPAEVTEALSGMRANLAAGGLLLVGARPLGYYRDYFMKSQRVERDGLRMTLRAEPSGEIAAGSIFQARFEVEALSGEDGGVEPRVHRQRHYSEAEILAHLAEARLECLEVFGHAVDTSRRQPLDESTHASAIYIARSAETDAARRPPATEQHPRQDSNLRPAA
jgi:SAM-dependent methyltransferase